MNRKDNAHSGQQRTMTLPGTKFLRRFFLQRAAEGALRETLLCAR